MGYIEAIKVALIVFPIIALFFTFPFILHEYHKFGSISFLRSLIIYSFILYMLTIYFLVILPLPNREDVYFKPNMIRLIPFGFIKDFFKETAFVFNDVSTYLKVIKEPGFYTVIFNIFMTIPFGMYLKYYFKCDFKKICFYSFLLSLFFEVTQLTGLYFIYKYPYRVFDVDDLIMNTLGGALGFALMHFIENFLPTRDDIDYKALKKGEIVSGFRRIILFVLDLVAWLFLTLIFNFKYSFGWIFLIYYIFIPMLERGKTFGGWFLNVRLEVNNYLIFILRIVFLFGYYLIIPYGILWGAYNLGQYFSLSIEVLFYFYGMVLLFVFFFYLINILVLLIKGRALYDNIIKVKYISTISIKNNKKL